LRVLAVIPARGGSKSIPKKNIKAFCGKPLISYSIELALKSSLIDRVIVSSDSKEIIDISIKYGAEAPFRRPDKLANDDTTDFPVFKHCLDFLKKNGNYEPSLVVHLRPTSPLRTIGMLEKAIKMMIDNPEADSLRGVCEPTQSPYKMWTIDSDGFLSPFNKNISIKEAYNQPRQKLPLVYWQNGYMDVIRLKTLTNKKSMTGNKILPLLIKENNIFDIDDYTTFKMAEEHYKNL